MGTRKPATVKTTRRPTPGGTSARRSGAAAKPGGAETRRRRRRGPADVENEVLRLGGRRGSYFYGQVIEAADAYAHFRDRETLRILRPVRDVLPDAPSVRELMGLAHYRIGNYAAAAKELEVFAELTNSVEQHPVLMDCYRAAKRWGKVNEYWEELTAVSPSAELVTEGRIVMAGAQADRGDLAGAVETLRRKATPVNQPKEHHLRLWYALADLEERAGDVARARDRFQLVRRHDPDFADVAERLSSLR